MTASAHGVTVTILTDEEGEAYTSLFTGTPDVAAGEDGAAILRKLNAEPAVWGALGEAVDGYLTMMTVKFHPGERVDTLSFAPQGEPDRWVEVGYVKGLTLHSAESERSVLWPAGIDWKPAQPQPAIPAKPAPAGLTRTALDGERLGRMAWMPGA